MSDERESEAPTRVRAALAAAGVAREIVVLPDDASTALLAAKALGVDVGQIANSLIFLADGEPLLVMASGAHRVNTKALAVRIGKSKISRASAADVVAATGQKVGGVAPVGHPQRLQTVIDESLQQYSEVWTAGGTANTVMSMSFDELCVLTAGEVVDISSDTDA